MTFEDLGELAKIVAGKVAAGEKLAFLGEADPSFPAALFGAALAGTQFVPLNYRLSKEQLDAQLKRIAPSKLITDEAISLDGIACVSSGSILSGAPLQDDAPDEDGAVAVELFTSGTTGEPKSAILRHSNLMAYIFGTVEFMSAGEDEAALLTVPPYHIAGIAAVLSSTYAGRRMVQLPNFSPEAWVELAKKENVTNALCMLGPEDHLQAFKSNDPAIKRRLGSAGKPIPSIELEIRSEDGSVCDPEETGLVWVKGDQVSGEYKGLGSQLDSNGWFPTKDRGFVDNDGYIFIDGRADDVIVRGGENISPGEIEDVIRTHDAIKDVAAIAVADAEWGEGIGLAIVCRSEVEDAELCDLVRKNLRFGKTLDPLEFRPR